MVVFAGKAQYTDEVSVESQFPGDQGAQAAYLKAVEKQANPKTSALRTTWLANSPGANWFISIDAGMGGMYSPGHAYAKEPWHWFGNDEKAGSNHKGYWHPTAGLMVGKWFSPVWGLRLNLGYGSAELYKKGKDLPYAGFTYQSATIDYMVNLKNFFLPYNPKGFFNPVLYLGAGVVRNGDFDTSSKEDFYGIAETGGLQLNFRLNRAFNFFLEGQALLLPREFKNDKSNYALFANSDLITNAKIGFTYNFNFRPFIKAPLSDQSVIDALNEEINRLKNRPETVCPPVKECPPPPPAVVETKVVESKPVELTPVFFSVGSSVVRNNQLVSVARAAQYLLDNPDAKLEIKAYADKKTGTAAVNLRVSEKRANAVSNMLVKKFGVDKSRVKVSFYGSKEQPFAENDKNRVAIFVK